MKKLKFGLPVFCFLLSISFSSLQAQQPGDSPVVASMDTAHYATLYIYRLKNFVGSMVGYNIHVNDSVVCRIKNNTKFMVKLYKEGPTEIWAETEQKRKVKVDVKFGQEYFLKCGLSMGVFVGRPEIMLVYPEQGRLDYDNLDAKNTRKAKNDTQ